MSRWSSRVTYDIEAISFEFVPEAYEAALFCVGRIEALGSYVFNYSEGESMALRFERWVSGASIAEFLRSFKGDARIFGDVYARRLPGVP
jgi:hypothetical protein